MTFQTQQKSRHSEIDKKRWLVRYLLIAAVAAVLTFKIYLLLYVIDFTLGVYSFFSSFVLLNIIIFSYIGYRDPYEKVKNNPLPKNPPLFSIVVPVKNEEEAIRNCVESCLKQSYENKEIIVVNDGSTDKTGQILEDIRKEWGTDKLRIFHLSRSVGKKQAVEVASKIARGEVYTFMDSDCDMAHDAVEKAAKIFLANGQLGALTSHGRVRGAHGGNLLQKMQDVYVDSACRAVKGAETSFSSVTCCSGSLSFYRRAAVQHFIHEWAHDKFLGMEFKFCTDRRMTAYVLGTKPPKEGQTLDINQNDYEEPENSDFDNSGKNKKMSNEGDPNALPILQTGNDDLQTLRITSDPDLDKKQDLPSHSYWNVLYTQNIRVNIGVPTKLSDLLKQQTRWKKSFIRSLISTGGMYWRRPFWIALLYYIQTVMKFVRPYVLFHAVFMLPLVGDFRSTGLWFLGIMFTGMIYAVDFRLRNPGDPLWLYRPIFTILTTFVYTWLLPYAALTIKNKAWR
ncbi:MAG TPA: glycosyltransferase [Nitrososphaeraceae archaeon]|nr:glycosyltransferase [Nitrososphaeraceae archaeon]